MCFFMSFKYSEQLREELKTYLKERYDLVIFDEEADQYLEEMADLFEVFLN